MDENRDLVVIESPGKLKTLYRVFGDIGFYADICATLGHFLENPRSLKDLAIEIRGGEFVETKRMPCREDAYGYLCDRIRRCSGRILVATDDDQEGHVIAQDVLVLASDLAPGRPVLRMLMGGLDCDGIRRALATLRPIDPLKSIPGTARRIADRIIGGCMSDFEKNRPVGRVQSALLELCSGGLCHTRIGVEMPCADGRKPFVGEIPVMGAVTPAELIAALGGLDIPPASVTRSETRPMGSLLCFGDALLGLHKCLDLDISQAAELLQQMYEEGAISYPRTASRGLTVAGIESAGRIARGKGLVAFKRDLLPRVEESSFHEAIRVLDEERLRSLDIGKPLKLHESDRDAALTFVVRRTLEAGILCQRDYPDLAKAPAWAREIEWKRDTRRAVLPWCCPESPRMVSQDVKAVLVETMMRAGIGRPSTYVQHAVRFAERELLDDRFELTAKGRDWLEAVPFSLKNGKTSVRMEGILKTEDKAVADLVNEVLELATGDDAVALETIYAQLGTSGASPEDVDDRGFRYPLFF